MSEKSEIVTIKSLSDNESNAVSEIGTNLLKFLSKEFKEKKIGFEERASIHFMITVGFMCVFTDSVTDNNLNDKIFNIKELARVAISLLEERYKDKQ